MSIFKCKMCGGELHINPGESVAVCEYCGTTQTLPKLDDDRRANLYDRANHFRRNNDFDKAAGIYEQILNEDKTDAEAYWSLVLCRYGIEYVEDPATHKRVPTVNRAQYTSVFDDEDYKAAIQYADAGQREVYEAEAKAINEIQKGILEISQKEEPFDVFICYKETDANGRRTPDSVLATDLYHQLTQEGFKVFFSRITLEDKLGIAYEPYIFAALNSAKVMVVLGTKPEYFNAVWVKNEWSRYLALIRGGAKKVLIPAYRDMDPYDLPEEFSHLQAQDMSKLGFMQDLIRGIKKLTEVDKPAAKETVVVQETAANTAPLLKRAFIFLEDGDWDSADEYCEKVLDLDPECAQAYLGKLMAELRVRKVDELANCEQSFDDKDNYHKVVRFGDDTLKGILIRYAEIIADRAEKRRKDAVYAEACSKMVGDKISAYEGAIELFQSISDWKNAGEQICICENKIGEIKEKEKHSEERRRFAAEKSRKVRKKVTAIAIVAIAVCSITAVIAQKVIIPNSRYNTAVALMDSGMYEDAISAFEEMNGYKDSIGQIEICQSAIIGHKYAEALAMVESGDLVEAYNQFLALGDYKDSMSKAAGICSEYRAMILDAAVVDDIVFFGSYEQDNDYSNGSESVAWRILEKENNRILLISADVLEGKGFNDHLGTIDLDVYDPSLERGTWEYWTIRQWLNESFLEEAFNEDEQAAIIESFVPADKNPKSNWKPGNPTQDKIFLLSAVEADEYFPSDQDRQCKPTKHANGNGAYVNDDGYCCWWLRSPGGSYDSASCVRSDGVIANTCDIRSSGVRPAMWITW